MAKTISFLVSTAQYKPFVEVTAEELVFGYDDTLVGLAHRFYPRHKRPMSKMGLLVAVSVHYWVACFIDVKWWPTSIQVIYVNYQALTLYI